MLAIEDPDPGDEPRGTHRLLVSQSLHRVHASRAACRRPPAQSLKHRHVQGDLERLELSAKSGRPLTDPWCSRLAALHLKNMIETGEDMEKSLVTPSLEQLARWNSQLFAGAAA